MLFHVVAPFAGRLATIGGKWNVKSAPFDPHAMFVCIERINKIPCDHAVPCGGPICWAVLQQSEGSGM